MLSEREGFRLGTSDASCSRRGDWREVPIEENGESLVRVPTEIAYPYYAKIMGLGKEEIYLRKGLMERIFDVRTSLRPYGFDLVVYDGWRSVELQENLFWYYMSEFTAKKFDRDYFSVSADLQLQMFEENRKYVSWPSRDPSAPSPHATGGAVDLWLYKDGKPVDLGVEFDCMDERAGIYYPVDDHRILNNRMTLLLAMTKAGLSPYPAEIWHFNFGNQMDALVKNTHAIYSYVEP